MSYTYKMPQGRSIGLKRLIIQDTYVGFMEGTRATASRYIREELPEMAARLLPPGQPLCVIDPRRAELPPWMCLAQFDSPDSVKGHDLDTNSRLYVCWFIENTYASIDDMVDIIFK